MCLDHEPGNTGSRCILIECFEARQLRPYQDGWPEPPICHDCEWRVIREIAASLVEITPGRQ